MMRPASDCRDAGWPDADCTDEEFALYAEDFEPTELNLSDGLDNDCDGVIDSVVALRGIRLLLNDVAAGHRRPA